MPSEAAAASSGVGDDEEFSSDYSDDNVGDTSPGDSVVPSGPEAETEARTVANGGVVEDHHSNPTYDSEDMDDGADDSESMCLRSPRLRRAQARFIVPRATGYGHDERLRSDSISSVSTLPSGTASARSSYSGGDAFIGDRSVDVPEPGRKLAALRQRERARRRRHRTHSAPMSAILQSEWKKRQEKEEPESQ